MLLKPGELIRPVDFQPVAGFIDDEYAKVDHVHDLSSALYSKVARDSDGNMVDNPEFTISQRNFPTGTSFTVWQADRWQLQSFGAVTANLSNAGSNIPPVAGIARGGRITVTGVDASLAGGDYLLLNQCIEGFVFSEASFGKSYARSITLSFWARSSVAGTFSASIRNNGANRCCVKEFSLEPNVWKLVILTFPPCLDGTWDEANTIGARLGICLSSGTTYQTSSPNVWVSGSNVIASNNQTNFSANLNATFDITGVKLEVDNYSPYARRRYSQEVLICQRYLHRIINVVYFSGPGQCITNVRGICGYFLPVDMRIPPFLNAVSAPSAFFLWTAGAGLAAVTSGPVLNGSTQRWVVMDATAGGGGLVAGNATYLIAAGAGSFMDLSAEI